MCLIGVSSRLSKTGYDKLEHLCAGLGSPAFLFVFLILIGILIRKQYRITDPIPYFKISLTVSVGYTGIAILSEFFKDTNKVNQFHWDLFGVAIYLCISYWYMKKNSIGIKE